MRPSGRSLASRAGSRRRAGPGSARSLIVDELARAQIEALEKRVAALERQMRGSDPALATPSAPEPAPAEPVPQPDEPPTDVELEVVALLRSGKGLEAIHTYVNRTGVDMATGKAEVARIASGLSPEDFL